jgi:hypothetical protein
MPTIDTTAPDWAQRFADDVDTELTSLRMQIRNAPARLPPFAVNELPRAADYPRCLVYVSDDAGGPVPAFSDGINWRRVTDRAAVS